MDGGNSLLKHMRLQHGYLHDTLTSSERPDEGAALWGGRGWEPQFHPPHKPPPTKTDTSWSSFFRSSQ